MAETVNILSALKSMTATYHKIDLIEDATIKQEAFSKFMSELNLLLPHLENSPLFPARDDKGRFLKINTDTYDVGLTQFINNLEAIIEQDEAKLRLDRLEKELASVQKNLAHVVTILERLNKMGPRITNLEQFILPPYIGSPS